jgi:hypothetical protein
METRKQTHDTQIFSAMVEILTQSGLGERNYGFTQTHHQTRLQELASVMNQMGLTNRAGKPLTKNTLKQVVHRVRQKEDLFDGYRPDWDKFREIEYPNVTLPKKTKTNCLVCGVPVDTKGKKLCSSDCVKIYQDHKDAPHDPQFPTIFHQMRDQDSLLTNCETILIDGERLQRSIQ